MFFIALKILYRTLVFDRYLTVYIVGYLFLKFLFDICQTQNETQSATQNQTQNLVCLVSA